MRTALLIALLCTSCVIAPVVVEKPKQITAVNAVLDDWHAAAAEADEARYLGHFAPEARFLGTDAGERWPIEEFREYVHEHFPSGGWTYHPHDRVVVLSRYGLIAWFDEELTNAGYGELRGTGALRRQGGVWRITHYSMTFTIPNEVARDVVDLVRNASAGETDGVGDR